MPLSQIKTNSIAAGNITTALIASGNITPALISSLSGLSVANTAIVGRIATAQQPIGAVLQAVSTTTTTLVTNSTGTYTSTGLSLNITPTSATSKILIMAWCPIRYGTNNGGGNVGIRINRASGTVLMSNNLINNVNAIVDISYPITLSYLDSPATTSSTNYTIEFALVNSSGVYANPTVNWNSGLTQTSTLTLMEIAA
jgi:hypothetical protein